MQKTSVKAFFAVLLLAISNLPARAQSMDFRDDAFEPTLRAGLNIKLGFGSGRTEVSLNGVPIRDPEKRQNMSCPAEESCAVPITIMLVAAVLVIAVINNDSKHNDR